MYRSRLRLFALVAACCAAASGACAQDVVELGPSGLPLPRFVSLSSSEVNVRVGPSFTHKVKYTFKKSGLPVEIVREFGNWRRIRDAEGEEGWVHGSLLSGRRTALVAPWAKGENVPLRAEAEANSATTAYLEPLVLAAVDRCDGAWCEVSGRGFSGVVQQRMLWGVYPKEEVR